MVLKWLLVSVVFTGLLGSPHSEHTYGLAAQTASYIAPGIRKSAKQRKLFSCSMHSQSFMQSETSLPCPKTTATKPYSVGEKSGQHLEDFLRVSLIILFNIILLPKLGSPFQLVSYLYVMLSD